ncbi:S41 family peptidase [Spongiimicrobium salis]|uniref:S41 family peptidase n=1 Tax=Spongiimicrobium salis TaxID=1667022 RepID=UPI00374D3564
MKKTKVDTGQLYRHSLRKFSGFHRKEVFLVVFLILVIHQLVSGQSPQPPENPKIKKHLLLEDLRILKHNLEVVQPGLYNYTSKVEMDAIFEEIKNSINEDMSSIDFFKLIAPLSDKIRNGHTIIVPSSTWEDQVVTTMDLLPLNLYFHKGQLYILHHVSDNDEVQEGSILKTVNGESATHLFDHMVNRWFKDGYNLTRPREIVEEEFRILYAHFFGATPHYTIEVRTPSGEEKVLNIKGIKETVFKKRLEKKYGVSYVPWWRRAPKPQSLLITNHTAYLKVTQFSNGVKSTGGKRFGNFIKAAFKKIKSENVKNVVLDLRGNQGGDVKPQLELLKHLVASPFHLYKDVHAKVRKLPNPQYYKFDLLSKADFNKDFVNEKINGVYPMKERRGFQKEPQAPSPNVFTGQLYVLIDGWTFSASGEVCGILKEHRKDAIFIGEETGGNPVTNISGIQTFMTLPHSKNRALICLVNYTTQVSYKNTGHGVQPQYEVRNTIEDMQRGTDAALRKVNALILDSEH